MLVTCAGILVADIIAADLPKVSEPGELTFTDRSIETHLGGHAGNVSIDLMKLGVEKSEVSTIVPVGNDVFGDFLGNMLESYGIIAHLQRIPSVETSKNMVLVVKGQDRRFHVDIGANWHLSPEFILSILEKEKPTIFYVGGTGYTGKLDEKLVKVLESAKKSGCLTIVDPLTPYKHSWDFLLSALTHVDVFHCNNDEAKSMTGKTNIKEAASLLISKGASIVVISLGGKGLIAQTRDCFIEMPAFEVPIVDPTGAGDALCAGLIRGILRTKAQQKCCFHDFTSDELSQTLLESEATGAACVTMVGTTTGVTEENVNKILREQGHKVLEHLKISRL